MRYAYELPPILPAASFDPTGLNADQAVGLGVGGGAGVIVPLGSVSGIVNVFTGNSGDFGGNPDPSGGHIRINMYRGAWPSTTVSNAFVVTGDPEFGPLTATFTNLGASAHLLIAWGTNKLISRWKPYRLTFEWATASGQSPPVNTVLPSMDQAIAGEVSTGLDGTWTGGGLTFGTPQWSVNNSLAHTGQTFNVPLSDVTKALRFIVGVYNSEGGASATSNPVTIVGPPFNQVLPTIDQAAIGQVSTGTLGTWIGTAPLTNSNTIWYVDGTAVANGTAYTPLTGDLGKTLTFEVDYENTYGTTIATSAGIVVTA